MASAWQTLEEAALTLGISSRTLHRRLARGEFETRLENGRREVLVVVDEGQVERFATPPAADTPKESDIPVTDVTDVADVSDTTQAPGGELSDEIQTTMLALHEDRIRRTDLAIMAYQQSVTVTAADARRAHRNSRFALGVAGGTVAAPFVVALWGADSVAPAHGDGEPLNPGVRQ